MVPVETGEHHLDLDPDVLFQGLERGLQMNRNLIGDWDLFVDAAVPLEELRTHSATAVMTTPDLFVEDFLDERAI